jgi:hypothetical protein
MRETPKPEKNGNTKAHKVEYEDLLLQGVWINALITSKW